ncbi:MAG: hypothetical protein IIB05_09095, partial [Bacteroidetes bacterium]|nr:hypothetical protein [Bacteroidota bacterium]
RSWEGNNEAIFAIRREMEKRPDMEITVPSIADNELINKVVEEKRRR